MFGPRMMELDRKICTKFCMLLRVFPKVCRVGTVNEAFILSVRHFADVKYHDRILSDEARCGKKTNYKLVNDGWHSQTCV